VELFIPVYLTAIVLTAVTTGWAAALAKKSGQRLHQVFFFFVIVNNLVCLAEVLFHYLPSRIETASGDGGPMTGFLVFPLMAAFTFLFIDFHFSLAGLPFPRILKRIWIGYWGLLFIGFLAAEFQQIVDKGMGLTRFLMPFFDVAIVASGIGSALFAFLRAPRIEDPGERRYVRRISGYMIPAFIAFGVLFYAPLPLDSGPRMLVRSLLGFLYLIPVLFWLDGRLRQTKDALLTRLSGAGAALDAWLEQKNLSPRERQIARCVLEGKSNGVIEKELFIGRRTVESHLYNIYRKTGVKNRLQLARLAAAETPPAD
jgi:DNA-binding CsgD family transcriptional regulator